MNQQFLKVFDHPGAEFRGVPFWAWNGDLRTEELRRQIRSFRDAGLGGFFMHSRVGLATPYLSDAWFECVSACVEEAKACGLKAWIYDEDRWPSGAAGGLVTKDQRFRQRNLYLTLESSVAQARRRKNILAMFAGKVTDWTLSGVRPIPFEDRRARLKAHETCLVFGWCFAGESPWFNDQTYLDTLNPEAVQQFLSVTHEAYRRRYGDEFGKTIPGVFTDEPCHGAKGGRHPWTGDQGFLFPWTDSLPRVFAKRYGYDLIPHLPEIMFDLEEMEVSQARYHYHDCVTFMFCEAFARPCGEWCGRHKLQFTGHVLAEDTLASQVNMVGSAMRFYEHMQAPGMDLLTEHWRIYDTAKQVSSVARQFGRKWRLSETYGCTGWDFPLAGHKALGDWQVAMGINLRAQHLAWYTMEGQAKRDYPAAISYQSSWWDAYKTVEDYFARVHAVMTRGQEVRDLLVLHPVESLWLKWNGAGAGSPHLNALHREFTAIREYLLTAHLDFDFGDEDILARHAVVRSDGTLRVGKAVYKAVLAPPMTTIRATTLKLLRRFVERGGTLVFAGDPPRLVDAMASTAAIDLAAQCRQVPVAKDDVTQAVECTRRVSITACNQGEIPQALYLLREDRQNSYLFVCNTGFTQPPDPGQVYADGYVRERTAAFSDVVIRGLAGFEGHPVELDPNTGRILKANATRKDGLWSIQTSLDQLGSRLFVVPRKPAGIQAQARPKPFAGHSVPFGRQRSVPVRLREPNVLVLDKAVSVVDGNPAAGEEEILRVDRAIRTRLGLRLRGGRMCQPWATNSLENSVSAQVALCYGFEVQHIPSGGLWLAMERPELYDMVLNGTRIPLAADEGWWVDRSLRRLSLNPADLHLGHNDLRLTCRYDAAHPGFEMIYLLGYFGVFAAGATWRIGKLPETLRYGDWTTQGLPFYAGHATYHFVVPAQARGRRCLLRVPHFAGAGLRIRVGGKTVATRLWPPYEVVLPAMGSGASTQLTIEILGHRRNSHGPLHFHEKWPVWTGPDQFVSNGDAWTEAYQLVPCGLLKSPQLLVAD